MGSPPRDIDKITTKYTTEKHFKMVKQCDSLAALKEELNAAGDKLVVVDFFATWCPPCKMIAPKLEEMSQSMANVVFLKVDVDQNDEASQHYRIEAMPTFLYFKSGKKSGHVDWCQRKQIEGISGQAFKFTWRQIIHKMLYINVVNERANQMK